MCKHRDHSPGRRQVLATLSGTALLAGLGIGQARANAAAVELPAPGPRDTCPVCGMFVAKYPEWVATVVYADGQAVHFDGAKDFFKYLADLEKYAPGRSLNEITAMGVTEYYSLTLTDARGAFYAIGSDVYGPMGHELIPLATEADATDFMRDHHGKRLVRYDEVDAPMLKGLDEGRFE
jgi:copper chaperone NosL